MPERVVRAESSSATATATATAPAIVITTSLVNSMEEDNPPIDEGRSTPQPPTLRTEAGQQQQQDPLALQRQSTISSSVPVPAAMEKYKHVDALRDAAAGAIAGAVAKTAVAPVERVKLLMQLQNSLPEGERGGAVGTTATTGGRRSSSAWRVARNVYRTQGVLAFWRGNTPNVLRQAGTAALNFMLMDHYKVAVRPLMEYTLRLPTEQRTRRRRVLSSFLSGGLAGGTTTTVLYPAEFLRTRLAMDVGATAETRKYPRGMRDVLCSTLGADGVRGLYQGYGIALAGVVLYRALHLGGYDALKNELLIYRGGEDDRGRLRPDLSMTERFVAAQTVSLVAGTMCYPIDSVRRRLMMQAGLPPEERLYRNSVDCFRKVWTKEGARGFYLGIGPNLVRSFGGALLLVGYDVFKGMIY